MTSGIGNVQKIADAAYVYVSARQICSDAQRVSPQMEAQRDAALHDLTLVCGFPCTTCDEDSCPGLILGGAA